MQSDGNFVLYRGSGPGDIQAFVWSTKTPWATQPHRVTTGNRLTVGQWLATGDYLVSDNGQFFAVMQSDGNFVLYRGSGPSDNQGYIWSISHTSLPAGQYFAIMQGDGNFVVYHGTGPSDNQGYIWSISHTSLPAGQYFAIMQSDGNFVVYHGSDPAHQGTPIWATNTSWVSHRVTTGSSLTADDWMGTNDYLLSSNQLFAACMQSDGDFGLYYTTYSTSPTVRPRPDTSRPFWLASVASVYMQLLGRDPFWSASSTTRSQEGPYIAVYKEDGYFILHQGPASGEEKDLTSYWSAGSQIQNVPLQATMQDDGNFVLYHGSASGQQQAYWATNTNRAANRVTGRSYLRGGEELDVGDCLVSSNGLYFAVLQADGRFVLYHTTDAVNASPDTARPYYVVAQVSDTGQSNEYYVKMQTDGNFVLYYRDTHNPLWATGTNHSSPGQYIAVLHDTGNLAVYSGSDPNQVSENTRLWQTNTALDPNALTIQKHSGDNQNVKGTLAMGNYIPLAPLVVLVKQQNGQPAPNVPVTFNPGSNYYPAIGSGQDVHMGSNIPSTDQNGVASLADASVNCYMDGGCGLNIIAQVASGDSVSFTIHITSS
jgi:hypothetical protein